MDKKPCSHRSSRWTRLSGNGLASTCDDCGTLLATDTVATAFPANPALANQTDPEEARAWREAFE